MSGNSEKQLGVTNTFTELPTVQELRRSTEMMWRGIFSSNELMHGVKNENGDKRKYSKTDVQTSHDVQTSEARID